MFQMYIGEMFKFYKRPIFTYFSAFVFVVYIISILSKFISIVDNKEHATYFFIKDMVFPNVYFSALAASRSLFAFCGLIMTCSILGNEFSWNTIKTISIRGTGRLDFIQTKILAILTFIGIYIICGILMFVLTGIVFHSKVTALAPPSETSINGVFAVVEFIIVLLALLPYLGIGAFFTLVSKSSAIGITIGMVYMFFIEPILSGVCQMPFKFFGDWVEKIPNYLICSQIRKIGEVDIFVVNSEWDYITQITEPISISLIYAAVFYIGCVWILKKRDILN